VVAADVALVEQHIEETRAHPGSRRRHRRAAAHGGVLEAGDQIVGLAAISRDTQAAFDAFARLKAAGKDIPGMEQLESRMRAALKDQRLAFLRRALGSYITRKSLQA
jgi:hypothetical protein